MNKWLLFLFIFSGAHLVCFKSFFMFLFETGRTPAYFSYSYSSKKSLPGYAVGLIYLSHGYCIKYVNLVILDFKCFPLWFWVLYYKQCPFFVSLSFIFIFIFGLISGWMPCLPLFYLPWGGGCMLCSLLRRSLSYKVCEGNAWALQSKDVQVSTACKINLVVFVILKFLDISFFGPF